MKVEEYVEKYRLVPVVVLNDISEVTPKMSALIDGGLPIAEITFRTACAKDAIAKASKEFPEMLVGAGTVINAVQCREAIAAGAKFIVSPGFSDEVLDECNKQKVPYFPGCVTPTEIMHAIARGLKILKFFPAQVYGGLKAINALGAAFPQIKFIPTGGADNTNLAEFLANPKIYAVGGSFMMKGDIKENTKAAMKIVGEMK